MERDPVVDFVRAIAVLGVITGHWLVTALVAGQNGLSVDSPLRWMHGLTPVSWILQTLGLFFFAGGFAAARSRSGWLRRLASLAIPVAIVLGTWTLVLGGLVLGGLPDATVSTVIHLVITPLWFLAVYMVLLALMPVMRWLDGRIGAWSVLVPVVLSIIGEFTVPDVNVIAVWWAPWQAGIVVARLGFVRSWGFPLLLAGIGAYFVLVRFGGYPASAVGGTGESRSNISPPSLAALSLATAQLGAVFVLVPWIRRVRWHAVQWLNKNALALFLLHLSALLTVALVARIFGVVPGLHTSPEDPMYPLLRLMWFPVLAATLMGWLAALSSLVKRLRVDRVVQFGRRRVDDKR